MVDELLASSTGLTALFKFQNPAFLVGYLKSSFLSLKLEPGENVALVFHVSLLEYDLSFLAVGGLTSTLVMAKSGSKVSKKFMWK